jgi:ATP phosphoribosyltransferase
MNNNFKKNKIEKIALLLKAVLAAEGKVGLMLNIRKNDLEKALAKLPALERPTVSALAEEGWVAVSTIVDEYVVRDLIPDLTACGATGIVEFPLNKIVL